MRLALLCAAWALTATAAPCAEPPATPTFAKKPSATRQGDKVKIEFALDRETDVAVYIENAKGEVVRHLVAGLLGPKAPAPLKPGLAQSLEWDGLDDAGRKAEGGPFKIRVGLGLSAAWAGTAFGSEPRPDNLARVTGLACAPDGRLYVLSERWNRVWWQACAIHVFRRTGEYERTVKPFAPGLPPERLADLTGLVDERGRPVPVIHRVLAMSFYPREEVPKNMTVGPNGSLHFLTIRAGYRSDPNDDRLGFEKFLASLAPDGGPACSTYTGAALPAKAAIGDAYLAAASDGKSVFVTGLERIKGEGGGTKANVPAVYRIDLPERREAKAFFGNPAEAGSGEKQLGDPRGLAADGKGSLYVADRTNNRVLVLDEKDGRLVRSIPVASPGWVGVHRKTGALYVAGADAVVKLAPGADGSFAEKARLPFPPLAPGTRGSVRWSFALDAEAEPAVLWLGRNRGGDVLMRCEDLGEKFSDAQRAGYTPAQHWWNLSADPDRRLVSCKVGESTLRVLDEETGATRDLRPEGSSGQIYRLGPDGQVYGMDHSGGGVRRWTREGKPLPFPETAADPKLKGRLASRPSGTTAWERDFCVDRAGGIWAKNRGKHYHGRMTVDRYDKDGKFLGTAVWVVSDGALGPRLDPAGNIYLAESVKPVGEPYPEFFKGKLPKVPIDSRGDVEHQYRWMYGSIIKFGPAGGAVWFPVPADNYSYPFDGEAKLPDGQAKVKVDTAGGDRAEMVAGELQGAEWFRYGCSYVLDMHPGHNRRCHCTATEFDVDGFGRTFYTDQGRFRVVVLDTAGNELTAFGAYGNQDCCGPESYVLDPQGRFLRPRKADDPKDLKSPFAEPAIAIYWFAGLAVTDRHAYVADCGNRRVLRVKLGCAAQETCSIQ